MVVAHARTEKAAGEFWVWGTHGGQEIKEPRLAHRFKSELARVVVGRTFFIATTSGGALASQGCDRSGCLGNGPRGMSFSSPSDISLPDPAVDIQLGRMHVLALSSAGQVYSWGANAAGQLGLGDARQRSKPEVVELLKPHRVVQILAVEDMSYALTDAGLVFAWGDNAHGALALDSQSSSISRPQVLTRLQGCSITQLEARDGMMIAYVQGIEESQNDDDVSEDCHRVSSGSRTRSRSFDSQRSQETQGTQGSSSRGSQCCPSEEVHLLDFWCWGSWGSNQIQAPFRPWLPRKIEGRLQQVIVAGKFFIVLTGSGEVLSWGMDNHGCLGLGTRKATISPLRLTLPDKSMESVVDLQCGNSHLLALSVRGQIYVWGKNQMGQLGLSDSKSRMQPTLLESEHLHRNVIQILAFQDRSYALTKSGVIYAWGSNADGTLGVAEDMGANVLEPTPVIRLEGIQVSHLEVQGLSRPALRPVKLSH